MAFTSTSLYMTREGNLVNGRGAEWRYDSSADSSGTVVGTGYFAAVMRGSRSTGNLGRGVSTGDTVLVVCGSTAAFYGFFSASTADQASTSASTGHNAGYNGTITALTAL